MKSLCQHIELVVFSLFISHIISNAQQINTGVPDTLAQRVIISDTLLLNDFLLKQPVFKVRDDISINLQLFLDLNTKVSSGKYEIKNLSKQSLKLNYTSPFVDNQLKTLNIRPNKIQTETFRQLISISQLGLSTHLAIVRPYLLIKQEEINDQLLIANHNVNIQVIVPDNARILKSSIPLSIVQNNKLRWEYSGVKVIPPIYLWYSTSVIKVELTKEVQIKESEVLVNMIVKNTGQANMKDLLLTTQFPAKYFEPDWKLSDGEFILEGDVMYTWKMKIGNLNANESIDVKFKLIKDPLMPYNKSEIVLYSKEGEILDIK